MKNRQTAGLLAIFLGTLGVHKFYLGQNLYGILFLLLIILFPLGTIISVIQGIIWLSQSDEEFNAKHGFSDSNTTQTIVESSSSFISSNLVKAKKYTQKNISKSYLTGCAWALASETDNIQYIFRDNNSLLISKNGLVDKRTYELIIDNNSILISDNEKTELYNIVLVQNDFLFLNKVSENRILRFANQTKFKDLLKAEFIKMVNEIEKEYNKESTPNNVLYSYRDENGGRVVTEVDLNDETLDKTTRERAILQNQIREDSNKRYNSDPEYKNSVDNVINNMVSGNINRQNDFSLDTKFYYVERGTTFGPITGKKLISLVNNQKINKNCFVRQESENGFENRAYEIVELIKK